MAQSSVFSAICGAQNTGFGHNPLLYLDFGGRFAFACCLLLLVVVLEEVILAHNRMAKNEPIMGIRGSKNEVFEGILLGGLRTEFPRFLGPAYSGRKCWWFLKSKREKEIELETEIPEFPKTRRARAAFW